jgi:hypothetical protein
MGGESQRDLRSLHYAVAPLWEAGGSVGNGLGVGAGANQLNILLQPQLKLKGALELGQPRLVDHAPLERWPAVMRQQPLLDGPRVVDRLNVHQLSQPALLRNLRGRIVESLAQQVVHQHPVIPLLAPLGQQVRRRVPENN